MQIPEQLKQAILAHAKQTAPCESCGFVVFKGKEMRYLPCENIAGEPESYFEISPDDWLMACSFDGLVALVHSHPDGEEKGLPYLSAADRLCQAQCELPFWLVVGGEIKQFRNVPPLLGREFENYKQDCSQLVLDAYALAGLDFGQPKPSHYDFGWYEDGRSIMEENLLKLGFEKLSENDPLFLGDVVLLKIGSPVPNHAGIYLGNQTMLHHSVGRLSARVPYDGAWLRTTHSIWRYKNWQQLHFTAILNDLQASRLS